MFRRRITFETLEKRKLLNADPVAAAPTSAEVRTEIQGLLRYQSGNSLLATQSALNEEAQRQEGLHKEVQQHWPSQGIADAWQPEISGDFNGDGRLDTVGFVESKAEEANGRLEAWLQINAGSEFYLLPWGDALPFGSELIGHVDVNGDGLDDLVSFDDTTNEVWVSTNSVSDGFRNQLWTRWSEPLATSPFVADFDQDGLTDVLVGTRRGRWQLGQSTGSRFVAQDYGSFSVFDWRDMVTGDFNGDGRPDVAGRAPDRTWWVWQGNDTSSGQGGEPGIDSAKYWGHWKMGTDWSDVRVADFNADGLDDLMGRSAEGTLHVATAVATDSKTEFHSWRWVTGWVPGADWRNVTIADVTQDGLPDVVGQAKDQTWWVGENIGNNFRNFFLDRASVQHVAVAEVSDDPIPMLSLPQFSQPQVEAQAVSPKDAEANPSRLKVFLKGDGELVVEGNGAEVRAIEFRSASGSLVPIRSFGTTGFNQLNRNEQVNIRLAAAKPITIDGELILGVKWNHDKNTNDLEVVYDVVNVPAVIDIASFETKGNEVAESIEDQADTTEPRLLESYFARYPRAVSSVEFATVENTNADTELNDQTQAAEPPEDSVTASSVDDATAPESGSEETNQSDVAHEPSETETSSNEQPEAQSSNDEIEETEGNLAVRSPVELTLGDENQFLLSSPELPIYALRIESPSDDLEIGSSAEPFDTFVVSDSSLVVYASESGVTGGSIPLDIRWTNADATAQVFAEFGDADSEWHPVLLFGERLATRGQTTPENGGEVEATSDPEESPNENAAITLRINDAGRFVIAASNQQVLGLNFRSKNEGLVPGSSPAPFELFVTNSATQITLGTFGRLVTFDGEITLDFGWNEAVSQNDLAIEFGDEDGEVIPLHNECKNDRCIWSLD